MHLHLKGPDRVQMAVEQDGNPIERDEVKKFIEARYHINSKISKIISP